MYTVSEEVEAALKAALSFLGNASHCYISIWRQGVLQDYKKDLVSFTAEYNELFSSATKTLLGSVFPEKAATHLHQMKTLRDAKSEVTPKQKQQGFQKAPSHYHQHGGQVLQLPEPSPTLLQRTSRISEAVRVTRTLCTHSYNIKRMCQPYNYVPATKRSHKAADSRAVTQCGSEVKSLPQQLATERWVLDCVQGFQIPFHKYTGSSIPIKPSHILYSLILWTHYSLAKARCIQPAMKDYANL